MMMNDRGSHRMIRMSGEKVYRASMQNNVELDYQQNDVCSIPILTGREVPRFPHTKNSGH